MAPDADMMKVEVAVAWQVTFTKDRLGAAVAAGGEQFERAAPSGGRDALARAVAWVVYFGTSSGLPSVMCESS
jgi:hypothetical protein